MSRLAGWFLAPAAAPAPRFAPPVAAGPTAGEARNLVALVRPGDAEVVAGGLAAALRGGGRALVACVQGEGTPAGMPAFPAATRTAERLAVQGLVAAAVGALARVALPEDGAGAAAAVRRAEAVAGGPVAVVLHRRLPELDGLVREARMVAVVAAADDLAALALAELRALNACVVALHPPAGPAARLQHRLGLAAIRPHDRPAGAARPDTAAAPERAW